MWCVCCPPKKFGYAPPAKGANDFDVSFCVGVVPRRMFVTLLAGEQVSSVDPISGSFFTGE